ncbi:MAG: hypothetical protein JNM42_11010 [Propionivibrio sp.]|uniref:hypothetical protein n=1 Tax=Propionivibrio sp. TaxID=2212460 RepID=UPI001A4EC636|nr:hypothetical protein [Propionivibrio sp.]MBL8414956.1 hypothetical protein [Propionivibrio sp.]
MNDDYVQEKTRRIVGREALRRASRMVQAWREDEQENARLAKQIALLVLVVAMLGAALFILF